LQLPTDNTSQKILIAGADGMIGNYLNNYFDRRYSVISTSFYNPDNKYTFSGDMTSIEFTEAVTKDCERPDVLIFLVGLAHAKGKGKDLPEFENVNYKTLVNLLSVLENYNKLPEKIIFASTISVYGEQYDQNQYIESLEPNPFSPYAVTKLQAEQYLLENCKDQTWILRFAPVYSSKFLLNINRRTKMGNKFYKIGNGAKKLSLCNIENIKAAVEGIIDGKVPAGLYNISDPKPYTYTDLLQQQGASGVIRIPVLAIKLLYVLGKMTSNIFLKENSIKLLTDNVFPSDKIRSYVALPATIDDVLVGND